MKKQIEKIKTTPMLLGGLGGAAVGAGIAYFTGAKNTKAYLIYAGIGLVVGGAACLLLCKKKDVVAAGGEAAKTTGTATETPKTDASATQENSASFVGRKQARSYGMTKERCNKLTASNNNPDCDQFPSSKTN